MPRTLALTLGFALALTLGFALALSACAPDSATGADGSVDAADPPAATGGVGTEDADDDGTDVDAAVTPPAAVAEAFAAARPNATDVEWSMEGEQYEASFTDAGTDMSTLYDADGTAGAVETKIETSALPAPVSAALARDYADAEVLGAERIVNAGTTTYEAEVRRAGRTEDVVFNADGTVVPADSE
jgi:hypothetical protein